MKISELTPREQQVSELIAWGSSKKEVAHLLFISERTVDQHVRNIYEKTGCDKINELSAWWFCNRFNISFNLSPLVSKAIAGILLIIFSYGEIHDTSQYTQQRSSRIRIERLYRRSRSRTQSCRFSEDPLTA